MAEQREPFPTEDPREKVTSDQNAEEHPAGAPEREGDDNGEPTAEPDADD